MPTVAEVYRDFMITVLPDNLCGFQAEIVRIAAGGKPVLTQSNADAAGAMASAKLIIDRRLADDPGIIDLD
jgi:hypothetical protein